MARLRTPIFALLLVLASILPARAPEAAEADAPAKPSLTDAGAAFKSIATEHGILSSLLALAIAAVVTEFYLLQTAAGKRETALATQAAEHAKELSSKDAAHAADRNEWQASYSILQESRLALMREVLAAIHSSTSVMSATQTSINERTQTAAELASQVSSLVSAIRDLRANTGSDLSDLRTAVRETSTAVHTLGSIVTRAS